VAALSADVVYTDDASGLRAEDVQGFFVGWPRTPSLVAVLDGADEAVLAREGAAGRVVGFVYAVHDGQLAAHVPLLEVLPEYHARGIGSELMRRMLAKLGRFAMVDVTCDAELEPFYERFGMRRVSGMVIRNPEAL
jgi:ribosomal protein S18 acetylase RimI-like enzyme